MRLVIITGASRGIGAALVEELATTCPNDSILALARSMPLKSSYKNVSNIVINLASSEAVDRLGDSLLKYASTSKYQEVVLINNAGMLGPVDFFDKISIDELRKTFDVNTFAPVYLSQLVMRHFSKSIVKIIHISSGVARYPMQNWTAYCMSKAALDMHAQVVRSEAPKNVEIISVAPGIIDTKMQEELRNIKDDRFVMKDKFVHYKEASKLKSPQETAKQIVELFDKIKDLNVIHSL